MISQGSSELDKYVRNNSSCWEEQMFGKFILWKISRLGKSGQTGTSVSEPLSAVLIPSGPLRAARGPDELGAPPAPPGSRAWVGQRGSHLLLWGMLRGNGIYTQRVSGLALEPGGWVLAVMLAIKGAWSCVSTSDRYRGRWRCHPSRAPKIRESQKILSWE